MNRNLTLLVLASAAGMLPAQTWTELGDAGQTLDFAQTVATAGACTTISGQCKPFAVQHEVHVLPGASVIGTAGVTVPANDNLIGAKIYAQYVVLGGLFGAPDLITVASNGLVHTIGRR